MIKRSEKGFTLIELLIVIVIIGILAGVLVAVIDPTSQQNRAKDAGIEAAMNKVVLATEGYISAYGSAPDEIQFLGQFKTGVVTDSAATCALAGGGECFFAVTGNVLNDTCPTGGWRGDSVAGSGDQCYFRYDVDDMPAGEFGIYAKSAGLTAKVFKYVNYGTNAGVIQQCDSTNPEGAC